MAETKVTPAEINNPYKFRAYRNAAANTGNGVYALVACDTEQYDTSSSQTGGVFTAPVAGYYFFAGEIHVNMQSENRTAAIAFFKNGTQCSAGGETFGTTGTSTGLSIADTVQLAAGDTVDMRAFCSATKPLNVGSAVLNFFTGFLISTT